MGTVTEARTRSAGGAGDPDRVAGGSIGRRAVGSWRSDSPATAATPRGRARLTGDRSPGPPDARGAPPPTLASDGRAARGPAEHPVPDVERSGSGPIAAPPTTRAAPGSRMVASRPARTASAAASAPGGIGNYMVTGAPNELDQGVPRTAPVEERRAGPRRGRRKALHLRDREHQDHLIPLDEVAGKQRRLSPAEWVWSRPRDDHALHVPDPRGPCRGQLLVGPLRQPGKPNRQDRPTRRKSGRCVRTVCTSVRFRSATTPGRSRPATRRAW